MTGSHKNSLWLKPYSMIKVPKRRNMEGFSPTIFHLHWGPTQYNNVRERSNATRLKEGSKIVSTQSSEMIPSSIKSIEKLLKGIA